MRMKIKELATVQMGWSFRSRLETSEYGGVAVIQMKDLLDDNTVGCDNLVTINMETLKDHHLAQKGDLIFRSRGQLHTAAVLLKDPGKAVIAAPLLRIRVIHQEKVFPEYLSWYINQSDAQIFLTSRARGSLQKMISKQDIEDLEITFPSLKTQADIIELFSLSARELSLIRELANKRKQYISKVLSELSKGE
jgi:restriction endonuclease S subunit